MNREVNFNLGITDANAENPWQATIFSYDGKTNGVMPRKTTLAPPVPFAYDGPTVIDPGRAHHDGGDGADDAPERTT